MKPFKYQTRTPNLPRISPIRGAIPEWYRGDIDSAMKQCVPFLDAMTVGFAMPLIADVFVSDTGEITWDAKQTIVDTNRQNAAMPAPSGHGEKNYSWRIYTSWLLPEGYSALVTHPLNRFDLPFTTSSGIVDGNFVTQGGNYPFFLKEGFVGTIPAGTPIAQIIPFKQDDWELQETEGLIEQGEENRRLSSVEYPGWYKREFWKKKVYK